MSGFDNFLVEKQSKKRHRKRKQGWSPIEAIQSKRIRKKSRKALEAEEAEKESLKSMIKLETPKTDVQKSNSLKHHSEQETELQSCPEDVKILESVVTLETSEGLETGLEIQNKNSDAPENDENDTNIKETQSQEPVCEISVYNGTEDLQQMPNTDETNAEIENVVMNESAESNTESHEILNSKETVLVVQEVNMDTNIIEQPSHIHPELSELLFKTEENEPDLHPVLHTESIQTTSEENMLLDEKYSSGSFTEIEFVFPMHKGNRKSVPKDMIAFVCEYCKKIFKRDSKLMYHKMFSKCKFKLGPEELDKIENAIRDVETNVKKPNCHLCSKKFKRLEEARLHYIGRVCQKTDSYHNPKNYKRDKNGNFLCPVEFCNFFDKKASKLAFHMKKFHMEKIYSCTICHQKFATEGDCKTHVKWRHAAKQVIVTCEICHKELKLTQIKAHMKYKHDPKYAGKKRYKPSESDLMCEICSYTTKHPSLLNRHQQRYHSDGPGFPCEVCGKHFKIKEDLKKHSIVHSDEIRQMNMTTCSVCTKPMLKRNLATHMKVVHQKVRNHSCEKCGKCFSTKSLLAAHEETHLPESERTYKFHCQWCGKGYQNRLACDDHENTHTGTKTHKCDVCGKSFKFFTSYTRHKELHGNAQFDCDMCTKVFPSVRLLNDHRARHQCNKKYICLCGKTYASAGGLHHHQTQCAMFILHKQESAEESTMTVIIPGPGNNDEQENAQVDISQLQQVMDSHEHVTIQVVDGSQVVDCSQENNDLPSTELVTTVDNQAEWTEDTSDQNQELPNEYLCGYCQAVLGSLEEVQTHMVEQHVQELSSTGQAVQETPEDQVEGVGVKTETDQFLEQPVMSDGTEVLVSSSSGNIAQNFQSIENLEHPTVSHMVLTSDEAGIITNIDRTETLTLNTEEGNVVTAVIQYEDPAEEVDDDTNNAEAAVTITDEHAASLLASIHAGDSGYSQ